ncbi:glycosyltransferase [Telluribacter sp. SYSU D00476]|uniref:glycosyltransferase n=1 Tax=Telluribacter sp. SYSU D00476 TaxID=2811430 RepID=UPI001FF21B3F|nr:glycosyltransferase [Telluribacter sp. SYSU D00476]
MSNRKNVAIVFFDAASGHRSSAVALEKAIRQRRPDWNARVVNITEVFDYHPPFGRIVHRGINYFNWMIRRDRVFDLKGLINLSLLCHDLVGQKGLERISEYWKGFVPDVVVSVTPMYNPVLYRSARLANPGVQCVTIPVDFEEAKPRYWFTPLIEQHYLNATPRLSEQARAAGIPDRYIHPIGGMIADPDSYQERHLDKKAELQRLGLNPELPTGFVSFGGQGSAIVLDIARELARQRLEANILFMCGKNEKLYQQLSALDTPYPKVVFSYLKETPIHYQHLADFAVGKPGAMTITEALITHTPMLAIESRGMKPVQKGNEEWIRESGTGRVVKRVKDLVPAIREVLGDPAIRDTIQRYRHTAILEALDKIELIMQLKEPYTI